MDDATLRAKSEALKDRLRAAGTIAEVNQIVTEIVADVQEIETVCKGTAAQIKNLAKYRRICIEKGWI